MKKFKLLLFLVIAGLTITSCDPKKSALDNLRDLSTNVTNNSDNYSVDEWKNFLSEYQKADSLINLYEYTEEEKQEIKSLQKQCNKYLLKAGTKVAAGYIQDIFNGASDAVKDAVKGASDETDAAADGINNMIDNAADAVKEGVNNAKDALKGILDGKDKK